MNKALQIMPTTTTSTKNSSDEMLWKITETLLSEQRFEDHILRLFQEKLDSNESLLPNEGAKIAVEEAFQTFDIENMIKSLKSQEQQEKVEPEVISVTGSENSTENESVQSLEDATSFASSSQENISNDDLMPQFSESEPIRMTSSDTRHRHTSSNHANTNSHGLYGNGGSNSNKGRRKYSGANRIIQSGDISPLFLGSFNHAHSNNNSNADLASITETPCLGSRVRFHEKVVTAVFEVRDYFTREETSQLFYTPFELFRFSTNYNEEIIRAETENVTWHDWISMRTDEDIKRDEEEEMNKLNLRRSGSSLPHRQQQQPTSSSSLSSSSLATSTSSSMKGVSVSDVGLDESNVIFREYVASSDEEEEEEEDGHHWAKLVSSPSDTVNVAATDAATTTTTTTTTTSASTTTTSSVVDEAELLKPLDQRQRKSAQPRKEKDEKLNDDYSNVYDEQFV